MFHWYGFFIGLAVVVGLSVAESLDSRVGKLSPWVIGLGFVGARAYHVLEMWEYYSQNWWLALAVWNGGLSIWGGLIGGGVGLVIANHKFSNSQIDRENILGAVVTALPLAQAIGRIGNGVNGEFVNKVWILPWWATEAVLDFALFCLIWRVRRIWPVGVIGVYLIGYALIRLVLQPFRL